MATKTLWLGFEDYGNTIYIRAKGKEIARIELSNLIDGK